MLELNFTPFPEIKTKRLILRQIVKADINALFVLRSDKRAMEFLDRPIAKTEADVEQLFNSITESISKNEGITWSISLHSSPLLIGTLGFWRIDKTNHRAEIGYMLHPEFQRKGIMHEAISTALDFGFNTLKFHSVEANVNQYNIASIKLLEKLCFIKEAHFKENYYYDGKFLDSVIYSLITPIKNEQ